MNEKAQDEEFEDDEDAEIADGGDDVDVEHLLRDVDKRKRATVKGGDPAWRKLERYREAQHTAELVSDFDDYNIGDDESATQSGNRARHRHAS